MTETVAAPSRADARRNRALVLTAARSAFAERGMDVPLGEIARRAGVGAGTVYRHFPSKEALFEAAVVDRIRLFVDTARELADVPDPGPVFFRFLASVVRLTARNKALCDALEAGGEQRFGTSAGLLRDFTDALRILLTRAQEAGGVRQDVDIIDVRALLLACLSMERRSGPDAVPGRGMALVCDSLRPGQHVTKLPVADERKGRNDHNDRNARNETGCAACGTPVTAARTGRPARYCGGACRQKAHRERTRTRSRDDASAAGRVSVTGLKRL
ncbi:helix-turn-helix domain-containing protein [Streptomyces varsoviensis]|uniref:TetR/AcrR family transcriptional regulator n=1 Tax=Streptomyces varsoviensis TaxID=67373 RepID=UPI0033E1E6F0